MKEIKYNLEKIGFIDFFSNQDINISKQSLDIARISAVHKDTYQLISKTGEHMAKMKGSLLYHANQATDYPTVGDFVLYHFIENGFSQIYHIYKRKTVFIRPDFKGHREDHAKSVLNQVLAANYDYVFIMVSLNNDFNVNRISRYVSITLTSKAIPVIILSKSDLCNDTLNKVQIIKNSFPKINIIPVSNISGDGYDKLTPFMKSGNTILLLGSSGVGKSSFVNQVMHKELMKVKKIREDDSRGRHTTTHRQLIITDNNVMIIDSPGIRSLGIMDVKEGIDEVFSKITELGKLCRFSNCSHTHEPNCKVQEALANNTIDQKQFENYIKLMKESKRTSQKSRNK